LTLKKGQMTTGRRSSPIPQVSCVSGPCSSVNIPVIQCLNRGFDGNGKLFIITITIVLTFQSFLKFCFCNFILRCSMGM